MPIYEKEDLVTILPHKETFFSYLKNFLSDIALFQENQERIKTILEDMPFLVLNQIYFDLEISLNNPLYSFFKEILPQKLEKAIQSSEGIDWFIDLLQGTQKTPDFLKPHIAVQCLRGYVGCKLHELGEKYSENEN